MREPILVINAGSSSIKFSVFETAEDRSLSAGAHGQVEGIGEGGNTGAHRSRRRRRSQARRHSRSRLTDQDGAMAAIHDWFGAHIGSEALFSTVSATASFMAGCLCATRAYRCDGNRRSGGLVPLAPLHQPHNIAAIRADMRDRAGAPAGRLLRHCLS